MLLLSHQVDKVVGCRNALHPCAVSLSV